FFVWNNWFTGYAHYKDGVVVGDFMYEIWLDSSYCTLVVNAGYYTVPKECVRDSTYGEPIVCPCKRCTQLTDVWNRIKIHNPHIRSMLRTAGPGGPLVRSFQELAQVAYCIPFQFDSSGLTEDFVSPGSGFWARDASPMEYWGVRDASPVVY